MRNKDKSFTIEILDDGRVRIDTDDMSGPIHADVEEFLLWLEEESGEPPTVKRKKATHKHAHGHSHRHAHKHKH